MRETVYLLGQISSKSVETYTWRDEVSNYLKGYVNIINPCNTEFNESIKDRNINPARYIARTKGIDIIVPKDKLAVKRSTIGLADLNQYDLSKPLVGTMFELAWYMNYPEKTVIAVSDKDSNSIWYRHPFIQAAVTTWVDSHEEACNLVIDYFCYGHSTSLINSKKGYM